MPHLHLLFDLLLHFPFLSDADLLKAFLLLKMDRNRDGYGYQEGGTEVGAGGPKDGEAMGGHLHDEDVCAGVRVCAWVWPAGGRVCHSDFSLRARHTHLCMWHGGLYAWHAWVPTTS